MTEAASGLETSLDIHQLHGVTSHTVVIFSKLTV